MLLRMNRSFALSIAMSLAVAFGPASEVKAAGLPYRMTGTLEEQARLAAIQAASGAVRLSGVVLNDVSTFSLSGAANLIISSGAVGSSITTISGTGLIKVGTSLVIQNTGTLVSPPASVSTSFGGASVGGFALYSFVTQAPDGSFYRPVWTPGRLIAGLGPNPNIYPPDERGTTTTFGSESVYTVAVGEPTSSLTLTPTLHPGTGDTRLLVNGVEVAPDVETAPLPLAVGDNTIKVELQWLRATQPVTVLNGTATNNGLLSPPEFATVQTLTFRITRLASDVPEIGVFGDYVSTELAQGAKSDFGHREIDPNSRTSKSFTIKNTGTGKLTNVRVLIDGPDAGDFSIIWQPNSTLGRLSDSTSFGLGFSPSSVGEKHATAHVWSNDADESPLDIAIVGVGGSQANFNMSFPGNRLEVGTNYFSWDSGIGASGYVLWFGSTPGGFDRGVGSFGSGSSGTTITSPGDGQPVYVTLWSLVSGIWKSSTAVFTDYIKLKSRIVSPANGAALDGTLTTTFTWDAGIGVERNALWLGTSPGAYDIYAGDEGSSRSRTVTVPASGGQIHATLYSQINGAWQSSSYVYTAPAGARSAIDGAGPGGTVGTVSQVLGDGRLSLFWNNGVGVKQRVVWVGTTPGGHDLFVFDVTGLNSKFFDLPMDGGPVYVTMWSLVNGAWQSEQSVFKAQDPSSSQTPRPAHLTSPANASRLTTRDVDITWDAGVGATQCALWVGSQPDGYDILAASEGTSRSHRVTLPGDGRRVHVTLHSLVSGAWQSLSYYFDAPTDPAPAAAKITNPAAGTTLSDATLPLTWDAADGATKYALWVGSRPLGWDIYAADEGAALSRTLTTMPVDGRPLYVTLWSLVKGAWLQSSTILSAAVDTTGDRHARILSPANGSTLSGAETSFTWDPGSGVTDYALWIGGAADGYDLFAAAETALSRTVMLPTDGRKIHVTLWSKVAGRWLANHYLYTAANITPAKAVMVSPAPDSTLASATATFTWSVGTKVSNYALWVGTRPGGYDLHAGVVSAGLSKTVANLPVDGSPVYVRLWSLINGAWQSTDYIFTSFRQS